MSEDTKLESGTGSISEPPKLSIVPPPESAPSPGDTPAKKTGKLFTLDNMPPILMRQRAAIRQMMDLRCAQPGSPIPPKLSARAADFIMMLVMLRANARISLGKPAFPTQLILQDDIARAAETTEIVIEQNALEAIESLDPAPTILHVDKPRRR